MKKQKIIYPILLAVIFLVGCGQGQVSKDERDDISTIKNEHLSKEVINYDTIPFRFLPLSEQLKRSKPYHEYGKIRVNRYKPDPTHYFSENEEDGYMVIENFTGVLHYRYIPFTGRLNKPYSCYKLEFYDPQSKKLRKSVDLIKDSPYNKNKYPIVGYGYAAMEDFTWESWATLYEEGKDAFYNTLKQSNPVYLTVNNVNARSNGYTIVEYQLIEMSEAGGPFGWEETLVVYDSIGNEVNRLVVPNDTQDAWTSDDGRFLIYIYGGAYSDNPHDMNDGGVKIYDFEGKKVVFHKKNNVEKVWFRGISMENLNYLNLPKSPLLSIGSSSSKQDQYKKITIINFQNRNVYYLNIDKSNWGEYQILTANQLLSVHPFIKETF